MQRMSAAAQNTEIHPGRLAAFSHRIAVLGLLLFSVFAPHSIAGAELSFLIAALGWFARTLATRRTGIHRSAMDLPILLFLGWTVASAFLSAEPAISLGKLQSTAVFLAFYFTQAIATRKTAVLLAGLMILSGVAGTLFSTFDLIRGRGVVITSVAPGSPFRKVETLTQIEAEPGAETQETSLAPGDTVWRISGHAVFSVPEVDAVIKRSAPGQLVSVSVIRNGEHAEWPGIVVTQAQKDSPSPSGITGAGRLHRFRASGWTKHYEYFAEILQLLSQLALGLALANFQNHGANNRFKLAIIATGMLAFGIAFTAMRSVLVAFAIGGCLVVWRSARGNAARFLVTAAITFVFSFGAVVVWQTRASHSLSLQDDSSALRVSIARVGLSRVLIHPLFGHGMDAVKNHWSEWGFPGKILVHLHSTPLQIAFDRGLPALFFWFWIMLRFWRLVTKGERTTRESGDTNRHGVLLGATGALAGFFVSSLVNYNIGAGVVALVFWWLMGISLVLARDVRKQI